VRLGLRACVGAVALSFITRSAPAQQNGALIGSLVDRLTRRPVEGARVSVLGTPLGASTDTAGRFDMSGVPAGIRVVQIRAIGYTISSWVVDLAEGQTLRQTFELEGRALRVDSIAVEAAQPDGWRSEGGFDRRRARGGGWFITHEDILNRRAETVSDLMRTVPGVMTVCRGRTCTLTMSETTRPCSPEYFLDGFPATFSTGPSFPINQIRGVEIYISRFSVPAEFQRPNLQCGVIAIWTVDPGARLGNH